MVECLVWDQDAAGSSPVTSTNIKKTDYCIIGFCCVQKIKRQSSGSLRLKKCKGHNREKIYFDVK